MNGGAVSLDVASNRGADFFNRLFKQFTYIGKGGIGGFALSDGRNRGFATFSVMGSAEGYQVLAVKR